MHVRGIRTNPEKHIASMQPTLTMPMHTRVAASMYATMLIIPCGSPEAMCGLHYGHTRM